MFDPFDTLSVRVSDLDRVFSGEHLYFTWRDLGCPDHSPTPQEAIRHWLKHVEPQRVQTFQVHEDSVIDETCASEGGEPFGGLTPNSQGKFSHESSD